MAGASEGQSTTAGDLRTMLLGFGVGLCAPLSLVVPTEEARAGASLTLCAPQASGRGWGERRALRDA